MCAVKLIPNKSGVIEIGKGHTCGWKDRREGNNRTDIQGAYVFWIGFRRTDSFGVRLGNFADVCSRVFERITVGRCAKYLSWKEYRMTRESLKEGQENYAVQENDSYG